MLTFFDHLCDEVHLLLDNRLEVPGEHRVVQTELRMVRDVSSRSCLKRMNESVSRRRIGRLIQEENLACKIRRKFKATTNSKHAKPVAPNLLDRHFTTEKPDQAYMGDITYIPTREGWLYLAVFIDRAVVGWSMDSRMPTSLVNDALTMAIWKRRPNAGLLVHSDRGSQYASDNFQQLLTQHGYRCSMSRKGNCWDKAPSESFFHSLKTELVHQEDFKTRA